MAGLPFDVAHFVVAQRFAIDQDHYAAIEYLKWHAESHRHHPLLQEFDTAVREDLMSLSRESALLFFQLLRECILPPKDATRDLGTPYGRKMAEWAELAAYLHFVDRTGDGMIEMESGIGIPSKDDKVRIVHPFPNLVKQMTVRWPADQRRCRQYAQKPEDARPRMKGKKS